MTSWKERYDLKDTPWDIGAPHRELEERYVRRKSEARALVPGCGHGHDARWLAETGLEVVALDVVSELDATAGEALRAAGGRFVAADALTWEPDAPFDVVFEHTFFCALEPHERDAWGALVRRCLRPGGRLLAIAYPLGKPREAGGPPYGYTVDELAEALGEGFRKTVDETSRNKLPRRDWDEHWVEFVREG